MSYPIKSPRKLIEVALPLDAINVACTREKSIRHGHPSTLHLWWARRPLAAARAVIFAQLVNDPGYQQGGGFKYGKNKKEAAIERKRLFKIIEDLVLWESTTNEEVLERARTEIRRSWREVCDLNKDHPQAAELFNPEKLPVLHDPFAGGGAIPLEAQRLGIETYASDLNPVAVLINKAMIEIPPQFSGRAPVGPVSRGEQVKATSWPGARGLAEDVRRYASWVRDEAVKRIGHLFPPVEFTAEMARERADLRGLKGPLNVIAWLWARTVKSPNPAFSHVDVPLVSSYVLATKEGKEAWIEPLVKDDSYSFVVRVGKPPLAAEDGTKVPGRGSDFRCLVSNVPISGDYIKREGQAGRMGQRLMAVVTEGVRGRTYLSPSAHMETLALAAIPEWRPSGSLPPRLTGGTCVPYGLKEWSDIFTSRQLVALTTLSELVSEVKVRVRQDAVQGGMMDDALGLSVEGTGATAYADAIAVYLAVCVDRLANYATTLCTWHSGVKYETITSTFGRQAFPMTWDFAEGNPFSESSGNFRKQAESVANNLEAFPVGMPRGTVAQCDAVVAQQGSSVPRVITTDPPYYDNIAYADLSDFFYVWLRRSLSGTYPTIFATISVPKAEELVAATYRHGSKEVAETFFMNGMTRVMRRIRAEAHPAAPVTIFYAFKQSDTKEGAGTSSTGWETFLDAVLSAGLALTGTWPMRTEYTGNLKKGVNALASSIVLVCRPRAEDAPTVSRREFLRELNAVLPEALDEMTKGSGGDRSPVAPVDLSQAIIGPGMGVFSKYAAVLEADGSPMSVRTALQLINRFLAEDDFDSDTRFCLHWFEQNGWKDGPFGDAETLSRAQGTSVSGVKDAGVIESGGGKVRLSKWSEYRADWDPKADSRKPVWETLHHLVRALKQDGESGAGRLLAAVRGQGESVRQLAYRLYTLCERQGWAEDARAYNELITSWTGIESAAGAAPVAKQGNLFEGN